MNNTTNGKATTVKETFGRTTTITININADQSTVWALLTNASDWARWNSTIVSLTGEIKQGETLGLVSTLDEKRTFKLTVKEFEPESRFVWGDRQGNRAYTITPTASGVQFSMHEKIGGLMYPLYGRFIPSFDEAFEHFAADLKREAEAGSNRA